MKAQTKNSFKSYFKGVLSCFLFLSPFICFDVLPRFPASIFCSSWSIRQVFAAKDNTKSTGFHFYLKSSDELLIHFQCPSGRLLILHLKRIKVMYYFRDFFHLEIIFIFIFSDFLLTHQFSQKFCYSLNTNATISAMSMII